MPAASPALTSDVDARAIRGSRVFDAPRELVFDTFTNRDHVSNWWGPQGFTTTTYEMDVRPGGVWRFTMHGPDGTDYPNEVVYLDVVRPERLAYTHGPTPQFDVTVTFDDEDGRTRVNFEMVFASVEQRNWAAEFGAVEGLRDTFDRLGAQLGERPFVTERIFDAPRDLVFRLWTESDHLMKWWGPKNFTVFHLTNDLRPGGVMHYGMHYPGSTNEMWGRWVYDEIVPPEKLVFISSFSDREGNVTKTPFGDDWPLETHSTITFEEAGGKTKVTVRGMPIRATAAQHAAFGAAHASMQGGWSGTFDQFGDYLARVH